MLRELSLAFAVFWGVLLLVSVLGFLVARACGGQGFRNFFAEAALACFGLCVLALGLGLYGPAEIAVAAVTP